MFSHNTSKLLNQRPQINFSYHISPDVTIEFLKQKPHDDVEDEIQSEEDEDFDYFNPLVYCAITMDEEDEPPHMGDLNAPKAPSKAPDTSIKSKKPSKSNENSSFVCNSADTTSSDTGVKKKRFSCHICSKTFGWTTDLKRHILIHTGERPFKCTMCFATFTRNFLLQKHKTKIHQCLSPNEISQLNNNVAKNLMEIKLKMREIENAKDGEDENSEKQNKTNNKKQKTE